MEPTIQYGYVEEKCIPLSAQYILAKAGITSGEHASDYVVKALNRVCIEGIASEDSRREIDRQRFLLTLQARTCSKVKIENLNQNLEEITQQINNPAAYEQKAA